MVIVDIKDPKGLEEELWRFRGFEIKKRVEKLVSAPAQGQACCAP